MIHTKASDLVKLLQKLLDAMGPLSEVWNTVKQTSNSHFKPVEVSLSKILTNIEQTVMLLGHVFNNISYIRRFNALKQNAADPWITKQLLFL